MIRKCIVILIAFSIALLPQGAGAALNAYMKLKGETQGEIKGDSTIISMDRADTIEVMQLVYEVVSPRDAASGLPTGKRQHKPVVIKKRIDKSSPLLFKALVTNEKLTDVSIRFFRPDPGGTGAEEHFFTIELEDARIVGIKTILPDTQDPAKANAPPTEEVTFVFGKIIWTFEDGGITAEDDWEAPVSIAQ